MSSTKTDEEALGLPEEPVDRWDDLDEIRTRVSDIADGIRLGRAELNTATCYSCESADGDFLDQERDAEGIWRDLDDCLDNLFEWQKWGRAWKELALELAMKHEPGRFNTPTSPDDRSSKLNNDGRSECRFCGSPTKQISTGFSVYHVCTLCGR